MHQRLGELAKAERIDRSYLGKILRLTLLASDIAEAVLDGRQSVGTGLPTLLGVLPNDWDEQRAMIAEAAHY